MTDSAEKLLREIEQGSYVRCERYGKTMPCGDCDACKLKARIIAHLSAHPVTGQGDGVEGKRAIKQLAEIVQTMRDNGIETPGWIEHIGQDEKLVRDPLTISATLMFWFDAVRENKITPFTEPKPAAPMTAASGMDEGKT